MASRIIELTWKCGECGTDPILGRNKRCPSCGSPREKGEMKMGGLHTDRDGDGYNDAASVTDSELLDLATAGPDWFCSHCGTGNKGDGDRCTGMGNNGCGAPRYGNADEDHPDFSGDHPPVVPRKQSKHKTPAPSWQSDFEPDPVDNYLKSRRRNRKRNAIAVLAAVVVLAGSMKWAFATHEVNGIVTDMSWNQNTIVQTWTQTTTRAWRHQTTPRDEVRPRNGAGEHAGLKLQVGTCQPEHYDDEKYACGTEQVCRSTTESYACGETCRDNGNGFATCSTKYCTRPGPDSCRSETKYCTRPIYKDKCTYDTQVWQTTKTHPASGKGRDTYWPDATPQRFDRIRYTADYSVIVTYDDGDETYDLEPGTEFIGIADNMSQGQSTQAESAYLEWSIADEVTLKINNLGRVRSVTHGGIELAADTEEE